MLAMLRPWVAGGKDSWGGTTAGTYGPDQQMEVVFAPRSTSESAGAGYENRVIEGAEIFVPPGVVINPHDRVLVAGVLYEVEGVQGAWFGLDGIEADSQVALKRVSG